MRTSDVIKSKYIRGKDLEGKPPLTLTISDVSEELVGGAGRRESKCILWFHEDPRGISLNKARVLILEAAFGPETDLWSGKRVKLYFDPNVEFGGRRVGGVGLRTPPGVVFQGDPNAAAWGAGPAAAPPNAPPPPVWDGTKWVVQQPVAALAPKTPPPPVWNATTGQWDIVNPSTGEIASAAPPAHQRPATISERVNAGHPPSSAAPDDGWGGVAPPKAAAGAEDWNDDIPF
jgi:hypothetical protein